MNKFDILYSLVGRKHISQQLRDNAIRRGLLSRRGIYYLIENVTLCNVGDSGSLNYLKRIYVEDIYILRNENRRTGKVSIGFGNYI